MMGNEDVSTKQLSLTIPFNSAETALLAYDVISVDKELRGNQLKRIVQANGSNLSVDFYGSDLKLIRVAVNALLKNIILIVKTIKQFQNL